MWKKILKIAAGIIALFIILLAVTPFFFKSKIINRIKTEANKNLNATLNFDNSIGLNLFSNFPKVSLTLNNLSIIGKDEFEGDTLLYARQLQVAVDLKTLWDTKEIPIRKLYAADPVINITYHKNGKASYDIFKSDGSTDTSSSKVKVKFDVYELKNGRINYDDQQLGFYTFLNGVDHLGSGNFDDMVFDLKTKTDIKELTLGYGGVRYLDHVKTFIDAVLHMDLNKYRFEFKNNLIGLNDMACAVNGFVALPNDTDIEMDLELKNNQYDFKKLLSLLPSLYRNKFEELQASGNFQLAAILKGNYNDHSMPGYGLHLQVKDGAFRYPSLPDKISDVGIDLHVTNDDGITDHTLIQLNALHALIGQDAVDAKVQVTHPATDAFIDAFVKGKINLSTLTTIVPMKDTRLGGLVTMDATVKGNAGKIKSGNYEQLNAKGKLDARQVVYESAGSMPVHLDELTAELTPLKVQLNTVKGLIGKSDINASGSIENFFGYMLRDEKIKGNLNLVSDHFNCNEFLNDNASPSAPDTGSVKPFKVPENIDFSLKSKIGSLQYDKYDIKNFNGNIFVNNGILSFQNTSLEMLNGVFVLDGKYNSMDIKKPVFDLAFKIQHLDIQTAFKAFNSVKALAPVAQFMSGVLNTTLHFSSTFDANFNPVLHSINSNGNLDIASAVISGCKPVEMMADALQLEKLKKLDLQKVLLIFAVNNGEVSIKPFTTKFGNYTLQMLQGITGLDKDMNFHFKITVPRNEFGSANKALDNLIQQANAKSPVPVKLGDMVDVDVFITGTMMKPEIKTNLRDMANKALDDARDALIKRAQDSLNNVKLQAEARLREEAQKAIAQAEQQAAKIRADAQNYANEVKQRGYHAADSAVNSVTNPVGKIAARAVADRLKKEADAKAQQIINEANTKSDAVVNEARRKAGIN